MNAVVLNLTSGLLGGALGAVATVVTAFVAYRVYLRQRSDTKRDAANTILVEIQSAERKLKAARASFARGQGLLENSYLMKTESWSSQKFLFIKDLQRDDWDAISEFYDNCLLYDEMLRRYSDAFSKNEQQVRVTASNLLKKLPMKWLIKSCRIQMNLPML